MKPWKLLWILLVTMSLTGLTGCSLAMRDEPEAPYIPPGCVAEVATLTRLECWITNAETGKREKHLVEAQPGYWLGRPRIAPLGQVTLPAEKPTTHP